METVVSGRLLGDSIKEATCRPPSKWHCEVVEFYFSLFFVSSRNVGIVFGFKYVGEFIAHIYEA